MEKACRALTAVAESKQMEVLLTTLFALEERIYKILKVWNVYLPFC
jgi:hypothetical protein